MANSSSTKTTSKWGSLGPLLETNSSSSAKKAKSHLNLVNHEILYRLDGDLSYIYFYAEPGKAKVAGEKKFKQVVRDSGWTKRAKLVRIRKIVKAKDPPVQKSRKK
jgi:hypothetical protein